MMTARCVAGDTLVASRWLPLIVLRCSVLAAFVTVTVGACYSGGGGVPPPPDQFYYPVGLAVSNGGNVLYAINSDFDLQWNGGTLQSYDLFLLRHDADALINANLLPPANGLATDLRCPNTSCIPFLSTWQPYGTPGSCLNATQSSSNSESSNGARIPLGQACAPAVDSKHYARNNVIIGAFATELKLSPDGSRLFAPIRGNASMTWADVQPDDPNTVPPADVAAPDGGPSIAAPGAAAWTQNVLDNDPSPDPFALQCFLDSSGQCTTTAGNFVDPLDTRQSTLPGEPFAMALTPDGTAVAMTHQTSTNSSLLLTACGPLVAPVPAAGDAGAETAMTDANEDASAADAGADATLAEAADASGEASANDAGAAAAIPGVPFPSSACHPAPITSAISPFAPSMQFVLTGVTNGGDGIAAIPHDDGCSPLTTMTSPQARTCFPSSPGIGCEYTTPPYTMPCTRPAFLETNHTAAVIDLIRYVNDDMSSIARPFLFLDTIYQLTSNETGTDQRGIAIDPTPRMACRHRAMVANGGVLSAADNAACAMVPSRVFIASRSPASLILGQIGGLSLSGDGSFNPDLLTISGNVPLPTGPSNVYLAPIVDEAGNYELRVFVVCFDENRIAIYNPETGRVENVIDVGQNNGPFAMAFDPFNLADVATNAPAPLDTRQVNGAGPPPNTNLGGPTLKRYRFAYVANFTYSFLQLIDLDNSMPAISPHTFENIVFTLGQPTPPKGQ